MSNTKRIGQTALYERLSRDDEMQGESKTLAISKWKSEVTALKKEKDTLYSQILDIRKEVKQAESVRHCIEKLLQGNRELIQVKKNELEI